MLLVLSLPRSKNQLSYKGTPFNTCIQGVLGWNFRIGKLHGLIYARLLPSCTIRTQPETWDQKYILATTSSDGVGQANSIPLNKVFHFADAYKMFRTFRSARMCRHPSCSELRRRVELSKPCLFGTGCSNWLPPTLTSELGACSFWALRGSSKRGQEAAWRWFTAGAWLDAHQKNSAVLGWADPAAIWIQKQQQSSGETSGHELDRNG